MQLRSSISVLRPGGGHRDIILLEEVGPVVHSHGATILWDGVDRITEGHLAPRPRHKLILHRASAVLGHVDERTSRLKGRQELELDLTKVWLIIGLELGWDLLNAATDLSIPGTQDQKDKFTGPLEVEVPLELEPPQAARGAISTSAKLTMASFAA